MVWLKSEQGRAPFSLTLETVFFWDKGLVWELWQWSSAGGDLAHQRASDIGDPGGYHSAKVLS